MSESMGTILIVGGTSGIGEAFARRLHSMGKKLVLTGRREERLRRLQHELPGIEYRVMDNGDLKSLPGKVAELVGSFPAIDTVWLNSGMMNAWTLADAASSSDEMIEEEMRVNATSIMILTRLLVPHLTALGRPAGLMITTSGLAFAPMRYPGYCATKAALHSFTVVTRQQLQGSNVSVMELVPPLVETDMTVGQRPGASPAMRLDDFVNDCFGVLDGRPASEIKEIAPGSAGTRVDLWRGSLGAWLDNVGVGS